MGRCQKRCQLSTIKLYFLTVLSDLIVVIKCFAFIFFALNLKKMKKTLYYENWIVRLK